MQIHLIDLNFNFFILVIFFTVHCHTNFTVLIEADKSLLTVKIDNGKNEKKKIN